jgi:hypothetical protein
MHGPAGPAGRGPRQVCTTAEELGVHLLWSIPLSFAPNMLRRASRAVFNKKTLAYASGTTVALTAGGYWSAFLLRPPALPA